MCYDIYVYLYPYNRPTSTSMADYLSRLIYTAELLTATYSCHSPLFKVLQVYKPEFTLFAYKNSILSTTTSYREVDAKQRI
jgi:hypothetical protein